MSGPVDIFAGLPRRHFGCIVADPPWRFKSNSESRPERNAMRHYDCMSLDAIAALPVKDLAADDCALFLWITSPFLVIGAHLPIMRAWGFKPSGIGFTWLKLNKSAGKLFFTRDIFMGGGLTTRKNAEFVVLGKRGRSVRRDAGVHEVIVDHRREHSRKPDEAFARIERYCAGPYLDLFSRETRPGWTSWGAEATKFDAMQVPA